MSATRTEAVLPKCSWNSVPRPRPPLGGNWAGHGTGEHLEFMPLQCQNRRNLCCSTTSIFNLYLPTSSPLPFPSKELSFADFMLWSQERFTTSPTITRFQPSIAPSAELTQLSEQRWESREARPSPGSRGLTRGSNLHGAAQKEGRKNS